MVSVTSILIICVYSFILAILLSLSHGLFASISLSISVGEREPIVRSSWRTKTVRLDLSSGGVEGERLIF